MDLTIQLGNLVLSRIPQHLEKVAVKDLVVIPYANGRIVLDEQEKYELRGSLSFQNGNSGNVIAIGVRRGKLFHPTYSPDGEEIPQGIYDVWWRRIPYPTPTAPELREGYYAVEEFVPPQSPEQVGIRVVLRERDRPSVEVRNLGTFTPPSPAMLDARARAENIAHNLTLLRRHKAGVPGQFPSWESVYCTDPEVLMQIIEAWPGGWKGWSGSELNSRRWKEPPSLGRQIVPLPHPQIGRASCRERV